MAEVTREMILDYMIRKGGVVKNVDLVRHFRKFLQLDEPLLKDRAREIFKERVNAVAYIKAEKGEKFLYLKQEFHPAGGLHRPPTGRLPNEKFSTSSLEDNRRVVNQRDSLSSILSSSSIPSRKSSSSSLLPGDRAGSHVAGASHQHSDAILHSYRPISNHSPHTTTISSPPPLSSSPFSPPPPPSSSSPFSPPPPISSSPLFSSPPPPKTSGSMFSPSPGQSAGPAEDDGESLLAQMTAELSSFGSFFGSFGPSSSVAGGSPLEPTRSNPPTTSGSSRPPPQVTTHSSSSSSTVTTHSSSSSSTLTPHSSSSTASSSTIVVNSTHGPMNKSPLTVRHSLGDAPTISTFGSQKSADAPTTSTFEPRRQVNAPTTSIVEPRKLNDAPTTSTFEPRRQGNALTTSIVEPRKLNDAPTFEPRRPSNGPLSSSFKPHREDDVPTTSTFAPWRVDDIPTASTFQPKRQSDTPTFSSFEPQRPGRPVESPTAPNPRQGTPTLEPRMEKRTLGPSVELPPELRPLGHSPTELRKLGPSVELPPTSPTRRQGSSGDHPTMNGVHSHPYGGATRAVRRHDSPRRQGSMDGSRRQGSFDRTHSPLLSPAIRVESPTRSPDSSSNGVGSPVESRTNLLPSSSISPVSVRDRAYTSLAPNSSIVNSLGVQLRRDSRDKPPDGKVGRSQSSASSIRRSRNLDKNFNLDSITRSSIMMTPPPARRKLPPTVAPKPRKEQAAPGSMQDIAHEGDDEGSIAAISDQAEGEYYEIDPLEKEWMLASAHADMESIHRLIMTDPSLINRKDFIQTALHWAAKHGRCDIISGLIMNGAHVDLKSGFTPLHLAALAGHDNVIKLLVEEYGANVNIREHSGKRPIAILNKKASDSSRVLLSHINNYGLPSSSGLSFENLATFSQPHKKKSSLERPWGSVGQLYDRRVDPEKLAKKRLSPRMSIRKSFSFRTRKKEKELSPKREKGNKRPRSSLRPDNWDV